VTAVSITGDTFVYILALFSIREKTKSFGTAAGVISRPVIAQLIASGENHGLV